MLSGFIIVCQPLDSALRASPMDTLISVIHITMQHKVRFY